EVNSQICDSTIPYSRCSSNSACKCYPMVGAKNVGVCTFILKTCSQLIPCGSSQECSDPDSICIRHSRCNNSPVCYPLSMINENICPSLSTGVQSKKWKQNGMTVAGGNGHGDKLNQLWNPEGIFIDNNQNIFIADHQNCRIVEWKLNETEGTVVVGGNGTDQLNMPTNVIVDEQNNSLIIADLVNYRVIRWFNENQQETLIENITISRLTMDKYGYLYISDWSKNEVRRWKIGENEEKLVAGGNGQGNQLNQFNRPAYIFVDSEQSVYVTDKGNHRVMKWRKDANEGIIVAGGNGQGNNLNQLSYPQGILVDDFGQIYIADYYNHRIMRWSEGNREGEIIIGEHGPGDESNQLFYPIDLSFDVKKNLYVSDSGNSRVQKFDLISE
ncbi:unnamed protein product, partial [Adineta ricciae]